MTALQAVAQHWTKAGWSIRSIDDAQLVITRKKGPSVLLILVGLLLTPVLVGVLLIILAFIARGDEVRLVTAAEAEAWLEAQALGRDEFAKLEAEGVAKKTARVESARTPVMRLLYQHGFEPSTLVALGMLVGLVLVAVALAQ